MLILLYKINHHKALLKKGIQENGQQLKCWWLTNYYGFAPISNTVSFLKQNFQFEMF